MHRNTYLFVTFLAIFAALVVGVNLGRRVSTPQNESTKTNLTPTPRVTLTPKLTTYINTTCGFTLQYPDTLTKMESTGSAILADTATGAQSIAIACQKDIPRPPLPATKIETISFTGGDGASSLSAKLYHDASPKDGTPVDILIFRNPKTNVDAYIAGYGDMYNQILATLTLLP